MYESKKTKRRDFTWEKNVDEMNGKRTCPRLLGRKKIKRGSGLAHWSRSDIGGKSASVTCSQTFNGCGFF